MKTSRDAFRSADILVRSNSKSKRTGTAKASMPAMRSVIAADKNVRVPFCSRVAALRFPGLNRFQTRGSAQGARY